MNNSLPNIPRPSQPKCNPAPGATAQAGAAAKDDGKKRENPEPGPVRAIINKMITAMTPSPSPTPSPSSYAMKDRKEQTEELKGGNQ